MNKNLNDADDFVWMMTRVRRYVVFPGPITDQMPRLIAKRRVPISVAGIIHKRMNTSNPVVENEWGSNYYDSGDVDIEGITGDHLIVLDSKLARGITSESELYADSALVLSLYSWNELKAQKEGVLYLSAGEVKNAQGKGYIKRNGIWVPTNTTVAKIWEFLGRGEDIRSYAQLVGHISESGKDNMISEDDENIMAICFNEDFIVFKNDINEDFYKAPEFHQPLLYFWRLHDLAETSSLEYINYPVDENNRLVGVAAPENFSGKKDGGLEDIIVPPKFEGKMFEYNNLFYIPVEKKIISGL